MKKKILSILIVLVIILLGYAVYNKFYTKTIYKGQQLPEKEVKSLVKKVSKIINVPEEIPVIVEIENAETIMLEQKFYAGSKDGDYLIMFPAAQKAMIYRKKENKLINVGPIIVDQPNTTKQVNPVEGDKTEKATTTKTI